MSVGLPKTKADWDSRGGSIALDVRSVFDRVLAYKTALDATIDADLQAAGYTSGEIATLRSAFTDLDKLRTIYQGTVTQATTYDFRTFAKQLTGVV